MTTMAITTKRLLLLLLAASSLFFSAPPLGAAAAPRPLPPPLAPSSPPPPPPPPPASPKENKTPEIGASVMLLGMYDWELISANNTNNANTITNTAPHHWSRCLDQLWRSTERTNAKTVNFVVTHHWVPPPPSPPARTNARGAAAAPISQYCLMHGTDGRPKCYPWTDVLVAELRDSLAVCFAEAMRMGLTVSVRPHLDDASPARAWRDALAFDPTANYGGFSYVDVMLNPVADALGIALAETASGQQHQQQTVYLSLQGEMGATVANYPSRWAELAGAMRTRVLQRAAATRVSKVASSGSSAKNNTPNVLIGLGINFTGLVKDAPSTGAASIPLFGWLLAPPPSSTRTTTPTSTASAAAVRALFNGDDDDDDDSKNNNTNNTTKTAATNNKKLDFLGISAYAPMSGPGFPLKELEAAAFNVADSLRTYGVDLKKLVDAGRLELHYSELGLGGAGRDSGGRPARSARDAAKAPWAGIDAALGNYLHALDPWRHEPLRLFALEFYTKLAAWLAAGDEIKTFPVSKVFIWSHNSFDVLGVYPESTNAQGSYLIPTVQQLIAAHNAKAHGEEAEEE